MVAHLVDVVDVAIIFNVVSGDIIFDVVYGDNVVDVVYGGNVVDVVYGGNIVDVVIAHTSLSRKILQDFTFHVKKGFAIRDLRGAVKVLFANFGTMKQKEKGIKKLITSFPNVAPFFSPKVMFMKCATVSQLQLSLSLSLSLSPPTNGILAAIFSNFKIKFHTTSYFVRGSITVRPTSFWTGLNSTELANLSMI